MTNRLITKIETPSGLAIIRVVYDKDWEEYQCRVVINGTYNPDFTYHTDDKVDALSTAKVMALAFNNLGVLL